MVCQPFECNHGPNSPYLTRHRFIFRLTFLELKTSTASTDSTLVANALHLSNRSSPLVAFARESSAEFPSRDDWIGSRSKSRHPAQILWRSKGWRMLRLTSVPTQSKGSARCYGASEPEAISENAQKMRARKGSVQVTGRTRRGYKGLLLGTPARRGYFAGVAFSLRQTTAVR